MKAKLRPGLLLLFLMSSFLRVNAQHINIETITGQVITESLSSVENITLPNENMVIQHTNSSPSTLSLYSIEKIYFDLETSNGQINKAQEIHPCLLANPVQHEIEVLNLPDRRIQAVVYSLQGEKLIQATLSSDASGINVSDLASGLYILKLDDVTLKFIKQ